MSYYINDLIWILSASNKYLSVDRSNFLLRELPLTLGTENNPSLCFQGDERTGLYSYSEGVIGFSCLGFVSFIFSNSALSFKDKKGNELKLQLPGLTDSLVTQYLQPLNGTLALTSDHWYTKTSSEATDDIKLGMAVRLDATTDALRALADSPSHYAVGVSLSTAGPSDDLVIAHMGLVTQDDWTDVIGTTLLTTGSRYYLSDTDPGQLVTTAPSNEQLIGIAVSPTTLQLTINFWT